MHFQVPRLRAATLRELQPLFSEMSKDQCIACTPVMVLGLPDTALVASADPGPSVAARGGSRCSWVVSEHSQPDSREFLQGRT